MTKLQHHKIAVLAYIDLAESDLEQRAAISVQRVVKQLSHSMIEHVRAKELGYCPALSYFQDQNAIDSELIAGLENIIWLAGQHLQSMLTVKLNPLFSMFAIKRMQCMAHMLPNIRVRSADAEQKLADYLRPTRFVVEMELGLVQKHNIHEAIERFVSKQIVSHIKIYVARVEIKRSEVVE